MRPIVLYIIKFIILFFPETRCFRAKRILYRFAGAKIGSNVKICSSVTIAGNGNLIIGDNTWIGHQVCIISSSAITIGKHVDIAPKVYIGTGTHEINIATPNIAGDGVSIDVEIGDGCWLGVASVILPGIVLGDKCVIAAGSVVNNSHDAYSLIAGVPGKLKKKYKTNLAS